MSQEQDNRVHGNMQKRVVVAGWPGHMATAAPQSHANKLKSAFFRVLNYSLADMVDQGRSENSLCTNKVLLERLKI